MAKKNKKQKESSLTPEHTTSDIEQASDISSVSQEKNEASPEPEQNISDIEQEYVSISRKDGKPSAAETVAMKTSAAFNITGNVVASAASMIQQGSRTFGNGIQTFASEPKKAIDIIASRTTEQPYHLRDEDGFSAFKKNEKSNKVVTKLQELDETNTEEKTNTYYEYSRTHGKVVKYDDKKENNDRKYLGSVGDETVRAVIQMLKNQEKSANQPSR